MSLWRHRDFLKLWIGETVSVLGSQVTQLALPLAAAVMLHATPVQMGILGAADTAPFLLIALFAGAWVDRMHRRRVMIVADFGRALLLGVVPVAYLAGWLSLELLYAVGFLAGVLTVFFDVAYQSYLPTLVDRSRLVEGNSKLEISRSVAGIAGPSLGGLLVQWLTAPVAMAVDAFSYLVSVAALLSIRRAEAPPERPAAAASIWREVGEGLRVVFGNPLLRAIAGCTATCNLFGAAAGSVLVLYATRDLHFDAVQLGLVLSAGSPGSLLGALLAGPLARRLGIGPTIVASAALGGLAMACAPLATGPFPLKFALLAAGGFLGGFSAVVYNVSQVSLRQTVTPDRLLGRMNATMRFLVWGTLPLGSLLGGALGAAIHLRATLWLAALGSAAAALWVYASPVRALREPQAPAVYAPVSASS